jgi:predicted nuclease of predicted toxin-antitoxin system
LRPKFLADENVDYRLVSALKKSGFEIISVLKEHPGIPDKEVLRLANQFKAILLTEDNDFGEWIFAHKEKATGVVFLRYNADQVNAILESLVKLLDKYGDSLYGKFVVVTVTKTRFRAIPD